MRRRHWLIVTALAALLALSLLAVAGAQREPGSAGSVTVEVTVWRRVSNPSLLYLSTRPQGGRWTTQDRALDMSQLSRSGRFHQSDAVTVRVPLSGGGAANVEVTVWRSVANPSLLYLSTRPAGGSWRTEQTPLDMSRLSASGNFHQSSAVLVRVPLAGSSSTDAPSTGAPSTGACDFSQHVERVLAATFRAQTPSLSGTAFYIGGGEWITNHHVVGTHATATLVQGTTRLEATVVGSLPNYDLALLRAQIAGVAPLGFVGERLDVAARVWIVGFPGGVRGTASISGGIVSKYLPFAQFGGYEGAEGALLQTDAVANDGNSGGPVVDACGDVAAILTVSIVGVGPSDAHGLNYGIEGEAIAAQLANLRTVGHDTEGKTPSGAGAPAIPTSVRLTTIEIPFEPDDIRLDWDVVEGASWYEVLHSAGGGQWTLKGWVRAPTYLDTAPRWDGDVYRVRACNDAGCSDWSRSLRPDEGRRPRGS